MKRTPNLDRRAYAGNNLRNKTVGIIGIGHIGRRVAELCGVLFNNTVLAYDPYLTTEQIAARGATKVALADQADEGEWLAKLRAGKKLQELVDIEKMIAERNKLDGASHG